VKSTGNKITVRRNQDTLKSSFFSSLFSSIPRGRALRELHGFFWENNIINTKFSSVKSMARHGAKKQAEM